MRHLRQSPRRQGGFIQGTILFALAILGVIIAAFAVSNTGSGSNTDAERDRVNAGVIVKTGSDLQDAVSRAMGDNWQAKHIAVSGTTDADADPPVLFLFDVNFKYSTVPRIPDQAFIDASYDGTELLIANYNTMGVSTENERVIEVTGLKDSVCRRINSMVTSTAWDATKPIPLKADAITANSSEGCFAETTANTPPFRYYRVVAIDAGGD